MDECEYCGQPTPQKSRVVERPFSGESERLRRFFWVIDPERLVFCDQECRVKWHALRRRATWMAHDAQCVCAQCVGGER
jgi:hypothetical protein